MDNGGRFRALPHGRGLPKGTTPSPTKNSRWSWEAGVHSASATAAAGFSKVRAMRNQRFRSAGLRLLSCNPKP